MKGKKTLLPAETEDLVDTTGAGDTSIDFSAAEVTKGTVLIEPLAIARKINLCDLS